MFHNTEKFSGELFLKTNFSSFEALTIMKMTLASLYFMNFGTFLRHQCHLTKKFYVVFSFQELYAKPNLRKKFPRDLF